ncbi:TetR/AcrR family transcriptional regulator [Nonomuraea roseola]|uniref:TetR/AcrR family transcriptional regulator n=1 Tax=Nonomuraea roseola TaxID=46179 RepID=A0ABV5PSE3_9ACTN
MRKRADQVAQTRERIVEAAVHLHGTVGPAATTVAGIAAVAGVTRLTVYRHFPDEEAIFAACSAHWLSRRVPPNPSAWAQVADPAERLRVGLTDLYQFYRDGREMLTHVYRDMAVLPDTHRRTLEDRQELFHTLLAEPFPADQRIRAVIGHAISFWTWRSLCLDNGLSNAEAVELMSALADLGR